MDTGTQAAATQQPKVVPGPIALPVNAIYTNGFKAGLTSGDVFVVLERNGTDLAVLNMSYTTAKTLAQALEALIQGLEITSKQKIMTAEYIGQLLASPPPPPPNPGPTPP